VVAGCGNCKHNSIAYTIGVLHKHLPLHIFVVMVGLTVIDNPLPSVEPPQEHYTRTIGRCSKKPPLVERFDCAPEQIVPAVDEIKPLVIADTSLTFTQY